MVWNALQHFDTNIPGKVSELQVHNLLLMLSGWRANFPIALHNSRDEETFVCTGSSLTHLPNALNLTSYMMLCSEHIRMWFPRINWELKVNS